MRPSRKRRVGNRTNERDVEAEPTAGALTAGSVLEAERTKIERSETKRESGTKRDQAGTVREAKRAVGHRAENPGPQELREAVRSRSGRCGDRPGRCGSSSQGQCQSRAPRKRRIAPRPGADGPDIR